MEKPLLALSPSPGPPLFPQVELVSAELGQGSHGGGGGLSWR